MRPEILPKELSDMISLYVAQTNPCYKANPVFGLDEDKRKGKERKERRGEGRKESFRWAPLKMFSVRFGKKSRRRASI